MSKIEEKRHSLAHLLAAAVLEIYPDALPTLGPAIDNGFYYDFDFGTLKQGEGGFSEKDLAKIEKSMNKILPKWKGFEGKKVSRCLSRGILVCRDIRLVDDQKYRDLGVLVPKLTSLFV